MANPRLIRKYINRRLYDTAESRYVNLDDLRQLVADGEDIQIIDQSSGSDITSTVLLQIIADEQRENGLALLDAAFLTEVIRLAARNPGEQTAARLGNTLRSVVRSVASSPASIESGTRFPDAANS